MQILNQGENHWKLRIESEDDLWVLARLANKGRRLAMLGERRDTTTAESGSRAKAAERKKMWIELRILSNEYQSYSGLLRVHGTIEQAPMDIGSHHTHLIEAGDEIELTSNDPFPNIDIDLLKDAIDSSNRSNVAVVVVENDEIILFEITSRGLREGATWTMRGGGKRGDVRMSESVAQSFQKQVAKEILAATDAQLPMILCGSGHAREKLKSVILDAEPERSLRLIATSMAGRAGANEIIRDGLANEFLEDHAIHKEMQLLEQVWSRINSNGAIAYGKNDLIRAMEEGAIETLLVAIDLLRDDQTEIDGMLLSHWIRGLDDIGGNLVQCSTEHDAGEQLMGLGGVVALLRYKMV